MRLYGCSNVLEQLFTLVAGQNYPYIWGRCPPASDKNYPYDDGSFYVEGAKDFYYYNYDYNISGTQAPYRDWDHALLVLLDEPIKSQIDG